MILLKRVCCTSIQNLLNARKRNRRSCTCEIFYCCEIFDNTFHEDLFIFLFNRHKFPFRRILTQPSALFPILTLGWILMKCVMRRIKSYAEKTCKIECEFARMWKRFYLLMQRSTKAIWDSVLSAVDFVLPEWILPNSLVERPADSWFDNQKYCKFRNPCYKFGGHPIVLRQNLSIKHS